MNEIIAICRRCGQKGDSTRFAYDVVYQKIVCPKCTAERKAITNGKKPATIVSPIKQKKKCTKCSYTFAYDIQRKIPAHCPYCATDVR